MSSPDRFKPYAPDVQAVVRLEEALPPEHPIHVFVDLVRSVDLSHCVIPPGPKGEKPYHPHALFGILAWGYLHGVRSARKLARLARQEATFVYLAGGGRPNYRTLARFRRDNAAAFTAVFQETVILALRVGLVRLGYVALDGTKLKANTSKHKTMSYGRMRQREAQLTEEIARLVEQAEAQDATEDQEYGVDSDGYSVAEELARRAARLAKIQAAREHLEAEQRAEQGLAADAPPVIADKEQRSFADTDARIMLMKTGAFDYAYNAQAGVDAESGVIVVAELTNISADVGELRAFRQEVARVAPLWAPDLNDGVIINFAPLWRLVPQNRAWQKEVKACWDALCAGKYDWSKLAMRLWPERVVPKCADDRSLAVAHDLESVFWIEGEAGKWRKREISAGIIERLVAERTSPAVKSALADLLAAPVAAAGRISGRRARVAR